MKNSNSSEIFNVFIDESGQSPYYNDPEQPMLTVTGVVQNKKLSPAEEKLKPIFEKFDIPVETEIHAREIFSDSPTYKHLDSEKKQEFVIDLILVILKYIEFYYSISAIKIYTKPSMQKKLRKEILTRIFIICSCS